MSSVRISKNLISYTHIHPKLIFSQLFYFNLIYLAQNSKNVDTRHEKKPFLPVLYRLSPALFQQLVFHAYNFGSDKNGKSERLDEIGSV